jgi:hypothetical protein
MAPSHLAGRDQLAHVMIKGALHLYLATNGKHIV